MQTFWMVLGAGVPTVRHTSKESAEKEAERLAKCNQGQEFTVLESQGTVSVKIVTSWDKHEQTAEHKHGFSIGDRVVIRTLREHASPFVPSMVHTEGKTGMIVKANAHPIVKLDDGATWYYNPSSLQKLGD